MAFVHHEALERALRWLEHGSGLVVDGDVGSGRSTLLAMLAEHHRSLGVPSVLLRGSTAAGTVPLGALAVHPTFGAAASAGPEALARVTRALSAELAGPRSLLLVDDLDTLDDASLAALVAVAGQPGLQVVAVLPQGERPDPRYDHLLRDAARLTVPSLDPQAMTQVLTDQLGGEVAAALVTTIAVRSAGNPRVALALARSGVWAGAVTAVRGVWTETGSLEQAPVDAVPHAVLGGLGADERDALELLAWFGVTDIERADRLLGRALLERLVARGRVALQAQSPSPLVTVSPRALARALRLGITPLRHEALAARARELAELTGTAVPAQEPAAATAPPVWWQTLGRRSDVAQRSLVDSATVLFEALRAQTGLRLRRWRSLPTVQNAVPLLRLSLLGGAEGIDVDEVFRATAPGGQDDPDDVASFVLLRAEWSAARGAGFAHGLRDDPTGQLVLPDPGPEFDAAMALAAQGASAVRVDRAIADLDHAHPMVREMGTLQHVHALLDQGDPDGALGVLDAWPDGPFRAAFAEHLAALRGDALLLQGRVGDAERWARSCLRSATERLDGFGIRLAARGLGTALLAAGDLDGASDAVDAALRLGGPGPLVSAFDERLLGVGAVVSARLGRPEVAHALAREIEQAEHVFRPTLDIGVPWVRAELAAAEGEPGDADVQEAADALWERGVRLLTDGATLAAVLAWAFVPVPLSAERARELGRVWTQVHAPLLRGLVELHLVLPGGDHEEILHAVHRVHGAGPLVRAAVAVAQDRARQSGAELGAEDAERLGGPHALAAWPETTRVPRQQELSEREREIVLLARAGASNREIASQLFVSVRTVESHLYRAMRKLGIAGRAELTAWSPVSGRPLGG
ncbi:MAG TPA: LuxR C-terminal-related transcriptional regulator [Cellulomonas sp.]